MDFKIGDDLEENNLENSKKYNSKLPLIIVIVISIVFGLIVFLISNAIFGKKDVDKKPQVDTQVELSDDNVKILYRYITYSKDDYNSKFLKEKNVELSSFSDEEKLYYALQFVKEDDIETTTKTENDKKIYFISNSKVKTYIKRFFGENAGYTPVDKINHIFRIEIDGFNYATLTYDEANEGYNIVFDQKPSDENEKKYELVKPYYRELTSATRKYDGTLILNEKVIYTLIDEEQPNVFKINIYKDYEHNHLLETRQNIGAEDIKENPVTLEKYRDKATTISYTFKVNSDNTYYFAKSEINS